MGATFDAASSSGPGAFPRTIPHTVGAGDDPAIVSAILIKREDETGVVTTVTFDGVSLTKHAEADEGGVFRLYLYKLAAPTQGSAKNLVISGTAVDYVTAINISALNADQIDILGAAVNARGDGALSSLVTLVDGLIGGLLLDNHVVLAGNNPSPLADQTERGEVIASGSTRQNLSTKAGADGGAMGWSWVSPATWFSLAAAIKTSALHPRQAISLARQKTSAITLKTDPFS